MADSPKYAPDKDERELEDSKVRRRLRPWVKPELRCMLGKSPEANGGT